MDLSKLPGKQSADPVAGDSSPAAPVPAAIPPAPVPVEGLHYTRPGADGYLWITPPEAMLHAGIGLVVGFFFASRFFSWVLHATTGAAFTWTFTDTAGNPITYPQSDFFAADLPVALFAVGLIFEAVVMGMLRRVGAAWLVVAWSTLTAVASLGAFVYLLPRMGGQILLLICLLMSAYVAWTTVIRLRQMSEASRV